MSHSKQASHRSHKSSKGNSQSRPFRINQNTDAKDWETLEAEEYGFSQDENASFENDQIGWDQDEEGIFEKESPSNVGGV